jgi:putative hydrolase of the HAD superfamily
MIKTIIFDFWGTLVENGVWSPIKQVRNILNIKLPFGEYVVRMEKAMMTSKKESLQEAFKEVCKEFTIDCSNQQMEELIGMWNKSWMLAKPYDEIEEMLKSLKEEYNLILVSNTDSFSLPSVLEKFDLEKYFNKKYLSFEVGMLKNDVKLIPSILEENDIKVKECVFIGDSIHSDMMAAKDAGIKGILVDRNGRRDFEPKIKNIMELKKYL